jgi:hypothetical protein
MAIMCVCVKIGTLRLVALGALKERYRTILYAIRVFTPAPGCATRDGMSRSELGCSKSSVFLYVRYTLRGPTTAGNCCSAPLQRGEGGRDDARREKGSRRHDPDGAEEDHLTVVAEPPSSPGSPPTVVEGAGEGRAWSSVAEPTMMPSVLGRPLLASVRALPLAGREQEGEAARRARGGADELLPRGRSIRACKHRHGPRTGELRLGVVQSGEERRHGSPAGVGRGQGTGRDGGRRGRE